MAKIGGPATRKRTCFYCDKEGCSKARCENLKEDIRKGWVKVDGKGFLLFSDGSQIPRNFGKGGAKELVRKQSIKKTRTT
jgi:hypothetical protein